MPYYIKVIIISFVASLLGLLVKTNRIVILIFFSFFLLLSAVVEYIGWKMSVKNYNNLALYNFFTLFEFIFYLFFFRSILAGKKMKRLILIIMIIYCVCGLLNILFLQKGAFHTYTYVLGCMLVAIFSIVYFYFLFRFPETGSLAKNPFFWIGIGLLFYYTCTFSLYGLDNFITNSMHFYNRILRRTGDLLNVLLYTLFSIGFLCKINFRKLSGLS